MVPIIVLQNFHLIGKNTVKTTLQSNTVQLTSHHPSLQNNIGKSIF